ncbi:hypothetical protein AYO41_03100 [Verrucomicrobia bacterium SCGC AG-212-E04]|nr:hypothetical protein AYO41_03100 [Verrucomicrobia bacterium SCGC AG-212-E04]
MLESLVSLVERVGPWGYVIIFVIVMLECQPGLGFFMPGETLVVAGGFFASQGLFSLPGLIVLVTVAAILGDTCGFEIGLRLGRRWLLRHGKWLGVREKQLDRVDAYFHRHGGKSVFFGHFMHIFRALMPFIAGSCKMPYSRFIAYNSVGCVLWATIFTLLGFFFGESLPLIERWLGRASAIALGIALFAGICYWLWHGARRRRRS